MTTENSSPNGPSTPAAGDTSGAPASGAPAVPADVAALNGPAKVDDSTSLNNDVFSNFAEDDLGLDAPDAAEDTAPVTHAKAKPKPTPEAPSAPPPTAAPTVSAEAPTTPAAPTAETPTPGEVPVVDQTPPPAAETDEQRQTRFTQQRETFRGELVKQYGLSEDEVSEAITNPEKVLPALLAKVHMNVLDHVQGAVEQAFPTLLARHQAATQEQSSSVDQFYKEWPELKDPKYNATVARVLTGYRQANPKATKEDVIKEGGVAALISLRLPIPARLTSNLHAPNAGAPASAPRGAGTAPAMAPAGKPEGNVFTVLSLEEEDS